MGSKINNELDKTFSFPKFLAKPVAAAAGVFVCISVFEHGNRIYHVVVKGN